MTLATSDAAPGRASLASGLDPAPGAGAAPPPPAPSLAARVLRSSTITTGGFVATQGIRLLSNLVLARLLFPEAFGMMALVAVVLTGLAMLSDVGLGPAIMGHARGDDPEFLDTAWTIQVARGVLLWLAAVAAAPAVAAFYGEPDLRAYLPVAALTLLLGALRPTRFETQSRHLRAGLVTLVEVAVQLAGVAVAVALALAFRSVWALVVSGVLAQLLSLVLLHLLLPGHRNSFRWEREAASDLLRFGKWILLATFCGFAVWQADKVILGRLLPLADFGLYSIAFFLASFPVLLVSAVSGRVLIPVYRDSPPKASKANAARIRRLRAGALAALLVLTLALALSGPWLVRTLYDARYEAAGGIVVLVAVAQLPVLLIFTCDQAALAAGDSRRFFWLTLARAVLVSGGLVAGWQLGGLAGAVAGQGVGNLLSYPVLAWLLRPHGAWDPRLDASFGLAALLAGGLALWLGADAVAAIP